jgi:hypothetical protein
MKKKKIFPFYFKSSSSISFLLEIEKSNRRRERKRNYLRIALDFKFRSFYGGNNSQMTSIKIGTYSLKHFASNFVDGEYITALN